MSSRGGHNKLVCCHETTLSVKGKFLTPRRVWKAGICEFICILLNDFADRSCLEVVNNIYKLIKVHHTENVERTDKLSKTISVELRSETKLEIVALR